MKKKLRGWDTSFVKYIECNVEHMATIMTNLDFYRLDSKHTLRVLEQVTSIHPLPFLDYSLLFARKTKVEAMMEDLSILPLDVIRLCKLRTRNRNHSKRRLSSYSTFFVCFCGSFASLDLGRGKAFFV